MAIVGASGYAARELIRIMINHPHAQLTVATSRSEEEPRLEALHPSLARRTTLRVSLTILHGWRLARRSRSWRCRTPPAWRSFPSSPAGSAGDRLEHDYRLTDPQVYADWYGHVHTDPAGLGEAVYGLPELFREQIPPVDLIANPGCYTSASILGLAPLIAEDLIERSGIIIDAKSGVSGAGRSPKLTTTSRNATKACRHTASASTGIRRRSTRC